MRKIGDVDWDRIAPLLLGKEGDVGRTAADNREFPMEFSGLPAAGLPGGIFQNAMASGTLSISGFVVGQ